MAIGWSQNGACNSASHAVGNVFSRRTMIQAGSIGLLGLGMDNVAALKAADSETTIAPITTAKSVIFIFLSGGPMPLLKRVESLVRSRLKLPGFKSASTCRCWRLVARSGVGSARSLIRTPDTSRPIPPC